MLVFLTSIRHPHNSNDFRRVETLFEMSLRSVCAQIDSEFRVVVVCNEKPTIEFCDSRVIYHVVDFPAPSKERRATIPIDDLVIDKGTKLLSGSLLARQFEPDYLFIFDADDLVSRRITKYVNCRSGKAGWYIDSGYALNLASGRVQRKHGLVRYCGTSLVFNASKLLKLIQVDKRITESSSQPDILKNIAPRVIRYIFGNHRYAVSTLAEQGLQLRPFPFRAVTWVQENGENQTITLGTRTGLPATKAFRAEFSIENFSFSSAPPGPVDYFSEFIDCFRSRVGTMPFRFFGFPSAPSDENGVLQPSIQRPKSPSKQAVGHAE
jgi:hypothetical protein